MTILKKTVEDIIVGLWGAIKSAENKVADVMEDVADAVSDAVDTVTDAVSSTVEAVGNAINDALIQYSTCKSCSQNR